MFWLLNVLQGVSNEDTFIGQAAAWKFLSSAHIRIEINETFSNKSHISFQQAIHRPVIEIKKNNANNGWEWLIAVSW